MKRDPLNVRPISSSPGDELPDRADALKLPKTKRLPEGRAIPLKPIEQRFTAYPERSSPIPDDAQFRVLPQRVARRSYSMFAAFVATVVAPILISSVYYFFIASNQYATEFRFTVKDTSSSASAATSSLLSFMGASAVADNFDNYLVADFLTSREAVEELQKRINLRNLYSRPGVDRWSRFNSSEPLEKLVEYWQNMVTAKYDQITGIATAKVRAFTPEDAFLIAKSLVTLSEELVNRISDRSRTDAVRFAEKEVERAQNRLKAVQARVTEYRTRVGLIDPNSSVVASNSTLIQSLRANLAQLETQLATLMHQHVQTNSPLVVALQTQIRSTKEQLRTTEAAVGQNQETKALSLVVGEYEQLDLERQFAQALLNSTMQALEQARSNAAAQHLYITPYVKPSLPQSSTYPARISSIAVVAALSFGVWVIGLLIVRSVRERFA